MYGANVSCNQTFVVLSDQRTPSVLTKGDREKRLALVLVFWGAVYYIALNWSCCGDLRVGIPLISGRKAPDNWL